MQNLFRNSASSPHLICFYNLKFCNKNPSIFLKSISAFSWLSSYATYPVWLPLPTFRLAKYHMVPDTQLGFRGLTSHTIYLLLLMWFIAVQLLNGNISNHKPHDLIRSYGIIMAPYKPLLELTASQYEYSYFFIKIF